MLAHSVVAAVSDRRRRSEIDATIRARSERRYGQCAGTYVALYSAAFGPCVFMNQEEAKLLNLLK